VVDFSNFCSIHAFFISGCRLKNMQFPTQKKLPLLGCSQCDNTGYNGWSGCTVCRKYGMAYSVRGKLLYWGRPLTSYHIALRRATFFLHKFELFGSIIFGLGFFGFFLWRIKTGNLWLDLFSIEYWKSDPGVTQAFLWLAISVFAFFVYRLISNHKKVEIVENYSYDATEGEAGSVLVEWADAKRFARKNKKDISKVFTEEVIQTIEKSFGVARHYKNEHVSVYHLFYALLSVGSIGGVFARLSIPAKQLQAHVAKKFLDNNVGKNDDLSQILFHAYDYAYEAKQEYVHVTELLYAVAMQSEKIQELLYDLKVDKQKLVNVIEWLRIGERLREQHKKFRKAASRRSKYGMDRAMTAIATPFLNKFSQDLTLAAKFGQLYPCVAREKEIDQLFRIIEGGAKSAILVGQRGVGKMSIVEGIAQRMIEDDVPNLLKDKRLVQISTSSLLAGTTMSGAQQRLIQIMNEVSRAKNIILFINNLHDLIGAGANGGGEGLDVSETLAEFLGTDRFFSFVTTTIEGFNKYILDSEIAQTLVRVDINEMDENQAIQVLESKVGITEYKHQVFFSYDAVAQAVRLAVKFLHDKNLPESAIELMTEAATHTRSKRGKNQLVTEEDVATIVGSKTGIPVTSISEDESSKLLRLEDEMHKRMIGQNEAVVLVASALRRARAQMRSEKRPIANFLFLGPTGVGKTELAKTIASVYFGGEERMIRVDMSEYQDKSGIYRLIGQLGQQGTGFLTETVRQNPFSLVLLDEMEKADPDILNLFLQVFDDGRLTDSVGRVIDFTNTIIIATSNAGTSYIQDQIKNGVDMESLRKDIVSGELKKYYKPEFLNRFDGIVLFKSLNREEIKQIAGLMLKRVEKDLAIKGIEMRVEDSALESLVTVGFDPEFGARPMRRAIQDKVENQLADLVLGGKLNRRDVVVLGEGCKVRVERSG